MSDLPRPSIAEATAQIEPLSQLADLSPLRESVARTAARAFERIALQNGLSPEQVLPALIKDKRKEALEPFNATLRAAETIMGLRGTLLPPLDTAGLDQRFVEQEDIDSRVFRSLFLPENKDLRAKVREKIDDTFEQRSDNIKLEIGMSNENGKAAQYDIVIIGDGPISSQIAEALGFLYKRVLIISKEDQAGGIWDRNLSVNNSVDVTRPGGICWPFQKGSTGPIGIPGLATIGLDAALLNRDDTYSVLCDDNQTVKTYIKGPDFRDTLKWRAAQHGVPILLDSTVDIDNIQTKRDGTSLLQVVDENSGKLLTINAKAVFIATGGGAEQCKLDDPQSQQDYERAEKSVRNQIKGIRTRHRLVVEQVKQLTQIDSNLDTKQLIDDIREKRKLLESQLKGDPTDLNTSDSVSNRLIAKTNEIETKIANARPELDFNQVQKLRRKLETITDRLDLEEIILPSILSRTMIDAAIGCWKKYLAKDPARFPLNQVRQDTKSIGIAGRGDTLLTTLAVLFGTDDVPEEAKPVGVPQLNPDRVEVYSANLADTLADLIAITRPRYRETLRKVTQLKPIKNNIISCTAAVLPDVPFLQYQIEPLPVQDDTEDTMFIEYKPSTDSRKLFDRTGTLPEGKTIKTELPDKTGVLVSTLNGRRPRFYSYFFQTTGISRAPYEQRLNLAPIQRFTLEDGAFTTALGNETNQQYLVGTASGIKKFPQRLSDTFNLLGINENTQALWVWAGTLNPYFILPWIEEKIETNSIDVDYLSFRLSKARTSQRRVTN